MTDNAARIDDEMLDALLIIHRIAHRALGRGLINAQP
jgi:hypothetical protein